MSTGLGWFIYQLDFGFDSDSGLHDLKPLVLELLHFLL